MNIKIIDRIGLEERTILQLVSSLMNNRKPKEGSFDYGFGTHGAIGISLIHDFKNPIQVWQSNKGKSAKSPIEITIEKHTPIF